MLGRHYGVAVACLVLTGLTALVVIGARFAFFLLPFAWTGEPARLAGLLQVEPASTLADVGAGDGGLAVEMARLVGARGLVYATEISEERRRDIQRRVSQVEAGNVRIIEAHIDATNLPDNCCEGAYLRAVLHHVSDLPAFARQIQRAMRPGGRVAVIDFGPGTLWFHGANHGIEPEAVMSAFRRAGFSLACQIDNWGGGTYLLLFVRD